MKRQLLFIQEKQMDFKYLKVHFNIANRMRVIVCQTLESTGGATFVIFFFIPVDNRFYATVVLNSARRR